MMLRGNLPGCPARARSELGELGIQKLKCGTTHYIPTHTRLIKIAWVVCIFASARTFEEASCFQMLKIAKMCQNYIQCAYQQS